jgi:hypothetical protein
MFSKRASETRQNPEPSRTQERKPGRDPNNFRYARWINYATAVLFVPVTLWASVAVYFDLPFRSTRAPAAAVYLFLVAGLFVWIRPVRKAVACGFACFAIVFAWWVSLQPSNVREWQPDVAETAWAEIEGNLVTVHNIRNSIYHSETDYTPRWETRIIDLSSILGADLFITYWGSPWIAHPIVSFHYGEDQYLAFSIEVRKEVGEGYSAVRGFFRQFELIYIVSDERDVVRLRSNYRQGEEVHAYRLRVRPEVAQALFREYIQSVNRLRERPQWYNALTTNCTTDIRKMAVSAAGPDAAPWDWRILLNGRLDEMLYERGRLAGVLSFLELKRRGHINAAARAYDRAPDFSQRIRAGRPGF